MGLRPILPEHLLKKVTVSYLLIILPAKNVILAKKDSFIYVNMRMIFGINSQNHPLIFMVHSPLIIIFTQINIFIRFLIMYQMVLPQALTVHYRKFILVWINLDLPITKR